MNRSRTLGVLLLSVSVLSGGCQDVQAPEISCAPVEPPNVSAMPPCAAGDPLCAQYAAIWQSLLTKRNGISPEYFADHFFTQSAALSSWDSGESFQMEYIMRIGWATIRVLDQFIVRIASTDDGYPQLPLPRDAYLSEADIAVALDGQAFASTVTRIVPVVDLRYCTQEEALDALRSIASSDSLELNRLSFYVPGRAPREDGHPYLFGSGVVNLALNQCIDGHLDLVTGSGEAGRTPCLIPEARTHPHDDVGTLASAVRRR